MDLLHPPPVDIAALLDLLQPGQLRISGHHGVHGLADSLLIDLLDVDLQAFNRLDGDLALGNELALQHRFIGVAFAAHGVPDEAALALIVTLLVKVLHGFKGDGAATVQWSGCRRFRGERAGRAGHLRWQASGYRHW